MLQNQPVLPRLKKFLFVLNPIAGERDKTEVYSLIKRYANEYRWQYSIFRTSGENDKEYLRKAIDEFTPEAVVAIGGDGTVSLVGQVLENTELIMGIIPAGSGNGLSKDLKIPQNNFSAAFESLVKGYVVSMDTLRANEYFFVHLADIGFNAHIVKLFNRGKGRGLSSYVKHVLKEWYKYPIHHYDIHTDNGSFSGKAFMVTVANSNQFGSNLTINPDGHWGDGRFEVIIIKPFTKIQAIRIFWRLLTRRIKFSPYFTIISCTKAHIKCEKRKTLQYDGEIAEKIREVNFKIKPGALRMIVPATTPYQPAERSASALA